VEGTVKGWLEDFFWTMRDPKPILGMTGTYFQATYAESKLFGQIDCQPGYSAGGFAQGGRDSAMSI